VDRDSKKSMKRKITALTLSALFFAVTLHADAQQPGKVHRIGYISMRSGEGSMDDVFKTALKELGYV
jgi:ABC-type proline/glycine betaine transport system substrate-binding protein